MRKRPPRRPALRRAAVLDSTERRRSADEQAALRRVATLVAMGASPVQTFSAVAAEAGQLVGADAAVVFRYEQRGRMATVVGAWSVPGIEIPIGSRLVVSGTGAAARVLDAHRPARADRFDGPPGSIDAFFQSLAARCGVGAPIVVEARLWGFLVVVAAEPARLPARSELRIAEFTGLLATAIANAAARAEARRVADEQAALRRLATLVAEGVPPEDVFAAVTEEAGRLLGGDYTSIVHYEGGDNAHIRTAWAPTDVPLPIDYRARLGGRNMPTLVYETGRPARVEQLAADAGPLAAPVIAFGLRSGVGAPISVEGHLWGAMVVAWAGQEPPPSGTETRLAAFTELLATAIGNAEAREELSAVAEEQAALRRVATLVALGQPPAAVFDAVAEEAARVLGCDLALVGHYDSDESAIGVGGWSRTGGPAGVGVSVRLGGRNVISRVFETAAPARMDGYGEASGDAAAVAEQLGVRASVGVPIVVEGRVWGAMIVFSFPGEPFPAGTEERLASFTELAATAIANAEAREELRRIAEEQAALRRVATLVAETPASEELFSAVAREVARVLNVSGVTVDRFEPDGSQVTLGAARASDLPAAAAFLGVGARFPPDPGSVATTVFQIHRATRVDHYSQLPGPIGEAASAAGIGSGCGAPIVVDGDLWGAMCAFSRAGTVLPVGTEDRLYDFIELVATAISNYEARAGLRRLADDQAALRRVATLVAEAAPPPAVFQAVAEEVGGLFGARLATVARYDADQTATAVGLWSDAQSTVAPGYKVPLRERNVATLVFQTGRAARLDRHADDRAPPAGNVRELRLRSSVAVPVSAGGRLWGAIIASTGDLLLPADTEARLADFAALLATAIANAEAQAELTASRARIVATADETRRRIERDLHDGAQQRLVSLGLQLRAAQAALPPELHELAAELDLVAAGLANALDELREYARGIHPAILAEGGLRPALRTLARRSAVPVELHLRAEGRLPEPVEVAAYYAVSEALTNAAKHSRASAVAVEVEVLDGHLRISVRDDGTGGADFARGSGLVGLKDRVEALGGRISVTSPPGAGTSIEIQLPLADGRRISTSLGLSAGALPGRPGRPRRRDAR